MLVSQKTVCLSKDSLSRLDKLLKDLINEKLENLIFDLELLEYLEIQKEIWS